MWAVATVGIAAVVFGVTFLAVSTASDSGAPAPDVPAEVEAVVVQEPDPDDEPPDAPATDTPATDPAEETVSAVEEEQDADDDPAEDGAEEPSSQAEAEAEVEDPIEPETDKPPPDAEADTGEDAEGDPEDDAEAERDGYSGEPRGPGPEGPPYAGPYRPPQIDGGEAGEAAGEGEKDTEEVEPEESGEPEEPQEAEEAEEPEEPEEPDEPGEPDEPDEPEEPEEPEEPQEPEEPPAVLPEFDEEALIYGGTGREGAILAGPGIVWSSGLSARTSWELLLPSAQIRASLVAVGLTYRRALGAPDNPHVIGWWEGGPAPGEIGNVLLAGHRDFTDNDGNIGIGVCWLLPKTKPGDFLIIRDNEAREHHVYTVTEAVAVRWNDPSGVEYLRRSETPIATLVTCEGSFDDDSNNYSHRRIIVAELTDTIPFVEDGVPAGAGSL